MSLFNYTAVNKDGQERKGSIDAVSEDVAIAALQRRELIVASIEPADGDSILSKQFNIFSRVKNKEIVMLSNQITTLFEAQVSALRTFRLLASESSNPKLQKILTDVANDLQSGSSIADSLSKHPKVFSSFYVNMVRSGEETGKLDEVFSFLAEYIDRNYALATKARNALIYPSFIIATFIGVMVLMLTTVIPRLSGMLLESGGDLPIYTKFVIGLSTFLTNYIWILGIGIVIGTFFLVRYAKTENGYRYLANARLNIPYVGDLYRKLYMSRIADSLGTTLHSGIPLIRGLEIAGSVVGDPVYKEILNTVAQDIQTGQGAAESMSKHPQFPTVMIAMVKVGEETGDLGKILITIAKFYRREVLNAVDTLVSLIEPLMIVLLGLGVGLLLASILVPIYNVSAGI